MTTLPATYAEAAAAEGVRIALEWIAEHSGPTGVFGPFGDQLYGRITMKMWAQAHPLGADDIIYLAETGSHEAQAALVEVISERSARNEPLGALGAYNTRCHRRGPPRKRGPKAMDNFVRDVGIFSLLCKLRRQLNLKPNFNAGSKMPCASVIAAQALRCRRHCPPNTQGRRKNLGAIPASGGRHPPCRGDEIRRRLACYLPRAIRLTRDSY